MLRMLIGEDYNQVPPFDSLTSAMLTPAASQAPPRSRGQLALPAQIIKPKLSQCNGVAITGHSLGGAQARCQRGGQIADSLDWITL